MGKEAAEFIKYQEENRRERQRRIDAGDETVRIRFELLEQLETQSRFNSGFNSGYSSMQVPARPKAQVVVPPRASWQAQPQTWQNSSQMQDNSAWNNAAGGC